MMREQRKLMEEDEQTKLVMQALRGANTNEDDFQDANVRMKVVEMREGEKDLPTTYDPDALADYFGKRPGAVFSRVLQVASTSASYLTGLAWDAARGKLEEAEVARAAQLRRTIVSLGPFFIKLGQALSIRPDILSPRAMVELQQLCDKVPSFPSDLAFATICEELDVDSVGEVFSEITPEPVAAASLGQVYKATLRSTGDEVAVKVQRPFVLETVTVDLFIVRSVGKVVGSWFPNLKSRVDIVALLDEWAARFFEELDYVKELEHTERFAESMAKELPQVIVPKSYPEYTSRKVLVSEWIEGEKLAQSTAAPSSPALRAQTPTPMRPRHPRQRCQLSQRLLQWLHARPHRGARLGPVKSDH